MQCWISPRLLRLWLIATGAVILSFSTAAQQRLFKRLNTDTHYQFEYVWLDEQGEQQAIQFALEREALQDIPLQQTTYRPDIAQRYVAVEMTKAARDIDPRIARINVQQRGDEIQVGVRAASDAIVADIQDQLSSAKVAAFNNYLDKHYYTEYLTPLNQNAIKPDHVRYIRESTMALIPLSQAFYDQLQQHSDARHYMNLLLGWVQSIPYNTLEDRSESHGSGFSPPFTLLSQNQGDCDSKAVLTASIMRAFLPSTPMVLVLLENHALLGIALPPRAGDKTITQNGITYVMFDPTGPALLPFGKVSPDTIMAIANRRYTLETIQ
ncbi:hypothetical protein [Alteromonas sp. H39]|uniref:hypothetical protein n=1 Tax=Alteromonas sp. H39 TaxID=3389876 RepID=UPI0039E0097D